MDTRVAAINSSGRREDLVIRRNPDLLTAETSDEAVVLSVDAGRYYGLGGVGPDIWRRLEVGVSFVALCDDLSRCYDADAATIDSDVMAWLRQLQVEGLITFTSEGPASES